MTTVPAQYQSYVNNAASALGIPASVVAAQINLESGFNPNARSYAGAEGIAQFIPSTFRAYGHGSPYNVGDAFAAYVNYMKSLLSDFHGNLRSALAAYNAGPGNIGAGMGYANKILSASGTGDVTVSGGGAPQGGGAADANPQFDQWAAGAFGNIITEFNSSGNPFSSIGDVANVINVIATDFGVFVKMLTLLLKPSFWFRLGAFMTGTVLLIIGVVALISAAWK